MAYYKRNGLVLAGVKHANCHTYTERLQPDNVKYGKKPAHVDLVDDQTPERGFHSTQLDISGNEREVAQINLGYNDFDDSGFYVKYDSDQQSIAGSEDIAIDQGIDQVNNNWPGSPDQELSDFTLTGKSASSGQNTISLFTTKDNSVGQINDQSCRVVTRYEWVDSSFIKNIEDVLALDNYDLAKYASNKEYLKVLEWFKCLSWTLVQLSNRPEIPSQIFMRLAAAFDYLTGSSTFENVPKHYPYLSDILAMNAGLNSASIESETTRIYLSPKRRAQLTAIRFKIGSIVTDRKFNELVSRIS